MITLLPLLLSAALPNAHPAAAPANYLFLGGDALADHEPLLARPEFAGAQRIYSWRSLEPSEGKYDLSGIESDVAVAEKLHKQLFVQVQDRFFDAKARGIPDYVLTDPKYGGGLAPEFDHSDKTHGVTSGWVTKQWNGNVRARFQALLRALARKFDGRIAGVNLPETAADLVDTGKATGFTCDGYFNAELDNLAYARRVFSRSMVVQYVNFWPCERNNDHNYMARTFSFAAAEGVGLGGPDVVPFKRAQMMNSYPFFHQYRGKLKLVAMAVQEPTLKYINPGTAKPFTREEVVTFARDYLGVDIIFWTLEAPWIEQLAK